MYVFYNKNNYEILTMVKPNDTEINIDEFISSRIRLDNKYNGLSLNEIGYVETDGNEYDHIVNSKVNYKILINPITNRLDIKVRQNENMDNKYLTYNCQDIKRNFTVEQISDMYNEDYINCNLKNIAQSNVLKVQFEYLKDLNIRTGITYVRWESFFTDPFLEDMGGDKLELGRDIIKNGTYYPLFICTSKKEGFNMSVVEGNHRAISLKLLQFLGEIPDDFRILCIHIPEDCQDYKYNDLVKIIPNKIITRHIFETEYGSNILDDKLIYDKSLEDIKLKNGNLINNYTIEYKTNNISDIIFGIHSYPLWVRDLIYPHKDIILPNKVINNEKEFLKWKGGI